MSTLRPYQERAIADLRAQYQAGKRAPVLVLPTGAGKTVVAAEVIRSSIARGNRVLFLVHRQELLTQSVSKLEAAGVTDLRIIQAGNCLGSPMAPVAVASIPTLTRWTERQPEASLVIVDEAHHVVAETWRRLADHYSASLLLGLTATPQRADGKPLGDIFDSIVVGATVAELVEMWRTDHIKGLVPCRVYAPPQELETGKMALDPVEAYQKHGGNQRAVVFCVSIQHAEQCAEKMNAAGIRTGVVHGKLSPETRKRNLAALDAGDLDAITSCHVLTEGWDSPKVAVCILARKPQHTGLYLQMAGRVLRPSPGKTHATLIDLCGSVHDHGPPDLEREYSLGGRGISKPDRDLIRQCPACGGVFRAGPKTCPNCGTALPSRTVELPESCGIGVIELDKLPKLPPRSVTLSISAKFASKCKKCGSRIEVGQQIYWNPAEKGARHADCEQAWRAA
jgi:DNA repair protein RadD